MPFGIVKKDLKFVEAHPGSGIAFRDQPVPHFHQAVMMACRMHSQLDGPKTLGWDIGLLEDGPCFLESNSRVGLPPVGTRSPPISCRSSSRFICHPPAASAVRVLLTGTFTDRFTTCWALGQVLGKAMASGRIEGVSRGQLLFTLGGTESAVVTALQVFKLRGSDFGASGVKIAANPREIRARFRCVRRLRLTQSYSIRPPGARPLGTRDGIVLSNKSSLSASRKVMIAPASSSGSSSWRARGSTSRRPTFGFSGTSS